MVRGETAGDAGVLASVLRRHACRCPADLQHRRRRHAPRVRLVRRPPPAVAAGDRARSARLSGRHRPRAASSRRRPRRGSLMAASERGDQGQPGRQGERPVVPGRAPAAGSVGRGGQRREAGQHRRHQGDADRHRHLALGREDGRGPAVVGRRDLGVAGRLHGDEREAHRRGRGRRSPRGSTTGRCPGRPAAATPSTRRRRASRR